MEPHRVYSIIGGMRTLAIAVLLGGCVIERTEVHYVPTTGEESGESSSEGGESSTGDVPGESSGEESTTTGAVEVVPWAHCSGRDGPGCEHGDVCVANTCVEIGPPEGPYGGFPGFECRDPGAIMVQAYSPLLTDDHVTVCMLAADVVDGTGVCPGGMRTWAWYDPWDMTTTATCWWDDLDRLVNGARCGDEQDCPPEQWCGLPPVLDGAEYLPRVCQAA